MRIAALYDIHGNLPALEAVMVEIRELDVEMVIVGGDVLPGPMPRQTLEYLFGLELPVRFVYGNGEVAVLDALAGRESPKVPVQYRDIILWNAEQVSPYRDALAKWPATVRLALTGAGDVLFCHATPRNEDEIFTHVTPEARLIPAFEQARASLVVCGHTHMQFDRTVGATRVVNAGSVGMPFGRSGADWLLLDDDVQLRHTDYDVAQASERIAATPCPQARDMFARPVASPPAEVDMIAAYEATALE